MDIERLLKADHQRVAALFARSARAPVADRPALLQELHALLGAHMELEESTVYPAVDGAAGAASIEEARAEHAVVRDLSERAMTLAPDGPGLRAVLDAAAAAFASHVREEEREVLPRLRGLGSAEQLEADVRRRRTELGLPTDTGAEADRGTGDAPGSVDVRSRESRTPDTALADAVAAEMGFD